MGRRPPGLDARTEPELDDPRPRDTVDAFDLERIGNPAMNPPTRPKAPPSRSWSALRMVGGLAGLAGLAWGGLHLAENRIDARVDTLVAADRKVLAEEMQRLDEEKRTFVASKAGADETMRKAEQQIRLLLEERKKLKDEKQRLDEELKKQNEARKKAEENLNQWEERERQAKEKRQVEETRRQQENAKRDEEAKILVLERARLTEEKKQLEQDKKQLEQEKSRLEQDKKHQDEQRKAREEKEKAKAVEMAATPSIDGVDKDLSAGRLTEPKGNNALEKLEWLAKLDAANKVLPPRWLRLGELLVSRADEAIATKDFNTAESHLKSAEKIPGAREMVVKGRQRLTQARESARRLDLDMLRQAEEEELLHRLEQQKQPPRPRPLPVPPKPLPR